MHIPSQFANHSVHFAVMDIRKWKLNQKYNYGNSEKGVSVYVIK